MATIRNERDVALQAAAIRVVDTFANIAVTNGVFSTAKNNGPVTPSSITLTGNAVGFTGGATKTWHWASNSAPNTWTLLGTGDTQVISNSVFITQLGTGTSVQYRLSITQFGYTDAVGFNTLIHNKAADDAVFASLSVAVDLPPASDLGVVSTLPTGNSLRLYQGFTLVSSGVVYTGTTTKNGLTLSINSSTGAITLSQTTWTSITESFTLVATYNGVGYSTTYSITKVVPGASGTSGTSGLSVILSNESHTFPSANDGTVSSYTNSGTEIRTYEGTTLLTYDGIGSANGTWAIGTSTSNITVGSLTDSGTYLTVGPHSGVSTGTDTSIISYTISGKSLSGSNFSFVKQQTFSKAKAGVAGDAGSTGSPGQDAAINYATSELWQQSGTNTTAVGKFGGDFATNGDGNQRQWGIDPYGRPALLWTSTNNDVNSDADGGWDKGITGLTSNKSYISIVYFKRTSSSGVGSFFHGCNSAGATVDLATGTTNYNPYFYNTTIDNFVQNQWYVSIGIIHASGSSATTNSGIGGIYRLSDGQRVYAGTDYKMFSGTTIQTHRTYLYYSTDPAAAVAWWGPGFYEINGNEPPLWQLTNSSAVALSITSNRPATFNATDGTLDAAQSDIIFTAQVTGLPNPTYVWSFSGFQTSPSNSGASNLTITSAQFGTSKAAAITCTVNGTYIDNITVARLEKSTASAGATVNQLDSITLPAIAAAQSAANAANTALSNIASDSILSPSEKPDVKLQYDTIIAEQSGIDAQAASYGVTTTRTTYNTAVSALTTYLGTLSGWNTIPGTDVVIVGTTLRSKFGDVYTARQALLNAIAAASKVLADNAQSQANTAVSNAATAQTSANTANTALTNLASDNILSPSEKPAIKLSYDSIIAEQSGIDAQAAVFSITTERTAYGNSISSLTSYLGTISGWNSIPGADVAIVGTTFRTNFQNVYTARQTLLNKISDVASSRANMDGSIRTPGGGVYTAGVGGMVGAITVTLPQFFTDTMLSFIVDIYEYVTGNSCTLKIGGYNHSVGNIWYNVTAQVIGGNTEYPVYFGHDGSKSKVWIGNPATEAWDYPQIRIRDVLTGYSNFSRAQWENGWVIGVSNTTATNVTATVTDTYPGANWAKVTGGDKPLGASAAAAAIAVKLDKASSDILRVSTTEAVRTRGIVVGDLAWDGAGVRTSGKGLALTPQGMLGHNGVKNTFTLNATTGDAIFAGTLSAVDGSFIGTLDVKSAVSGERMEIKNNVIKVYDAGGVVRVQIGNLAL